MITRSETFAPLAEPRPERAAPVSVPVLAAVPSAPEVEHPPPAGPDRAGGRTGGPPPAAVGLLGAGSALLGVGFAFVQPGEPIWLSLILAVSGLLAVSGGVHLAWTGSAVAARWQEARRNRLAARVRWRGLNMATCPACGRVMASAVLSQQQLLEAHQPLCSSLGGPGAHTAASDRPAQPPPGLAL